MDKSLDWLLDRILSFGDICVLADGEGNTHSYRQLYQEIQNAKEFLKQSGIRSPKVLALEGDYDFHAIAMFLALALEGHVVVPFLKGDNTLEQRLNISAAAGVLSRVSGTWGVKAYDNKTDVTSPLIDSLFTSKSPGLVLFSSGSSGEPKAMIHNFSRLCGVFESRRKKNLSILSFLLFDHIGGVNTLLNALASGMTLVAVKDRKPATVAAQIETFQVRVLPTTPTFLNLMMMSGVLDSFDLSSLRVITYGTEPMPISLLERLKQAFGRVKFVQTFGTSETGISPSKSLSSGSNFMKLDDAGIEHKIVNGELWLRSRTQILGYLNASSERFSEDGWFNTGDQVELGEGGYFRIIGRDSDVINVGGEKVLPIEVESVLLEIPEIAGCQVYGIDNAITGQSVAVNLVLGDEVDPKELRKQIRQHCRTRLARFKMPSRIRVVEALTFNARFKKKEPSL